MERQFKAGDIVRHFKRETVDAATDQYLYEIIGEAENSETGEMVMVYRPLYGEKKLFVRPLAMFMSETDHKKYPGIRQKYRFEKDDRDVYNVIFESAVTDEGTCVSAMRIDYGDTQIDEADPDTFAVYMSSFVEAGQDAGKPYAYYDASKPLKIVRTEIHGSILKVYFRLAEAPVLTWLKESRNVPAALSFRIEQRKPMKAHSRDGRDLIVNGRYRSDASSWKDLENRELSEYEDVQDRISYQYHRGSENGLIVYFHGNGEGDINGATRNNAAQILANRGGSVWVSDARKIFGDVHVMAFQAPDMWYFAKRDGLIEICGDEIMQVIEREKIDPDKVWIAGISAGGFMSVRMILRYPDLFRSAMITCPALDAANARSHTDNANLTDEELARLPEARTAIWLVQGETDSAVDPELCARRIWKFLSENRQTSSEHYEGGQGIASAFTTYETADGRYRMSLYETSDLKEITGISGEVRPGGRISTVQDYDLSGIPQKVKYNDHWTWVFTFRNDPQSSDGTHIWEWAKNI